MMEEECHKFKTSVSRTADHCNAYLHLSPPSIWGLDCISSQQCSECVNHKVHKVHKANQDKATRPRPF
jgi:hypothetical protein